LGLDQKPPRRFVIRCGKGGDHGGKKQRLGLRKERRHPCLVSAPVSSSKKAEGDSEYEQGGKHLKTFNKGKIPPTLIRGSSEIIGGEGATREVQDFRPNSEDPKTHVGIQIFIMRLRQKARQGGGRAGGITEGGGTRRIEKGAYPRKNCSRLLGKKGGGKRR